MDEVNRKRGYIAVRMLELLFAASFVFGIMWQGAETFVLSVPQFLMLYGGTGTLVCEIAARALGKRSTGKFREKREK